MSNTSSSAKLAGLLERLGQPTLDYGVSMARWPESMKAAFVELGPDEALLEYLERILASRASVATTRLQRFLRCFVSDFDVNALLRMYPMHLFGTAQAERLFGKRPAGKLLDLGAGSGDVTSALVPLFDQIEVVETSRVAARRLRERGFTCSGYDVTAQGIRGGPYDVIALLNVLDRTDRPRTLLEKCRNAMNEGTRLLLSTPLPYRPHVYAGGRARDPKERLAVVGHDFSDALMRLVVDTLQPLGLVPTRLTRVPYLSGGDSECPVTVLSAAVTVCRRVAG